MLDFKGMKWNQNNIANLGESVFQNQTKWIESEGHRLECGLESSNVYFGMVFNRNIYV